MEEKEEKMDKQSEASSYTANGTKKKKLPDSVALKIKESGKEKQKNMGILVTQKIGKLEGISFKCRMCECDFPSSEKVYLSDCGHEFC